MGLLVDVCYGLAGVAYAPVLAWQAIRFGKNRTGWRERFGRAPDLPAHPERIWIHAVSVGEVNATRRLITEVERDRPGAEIVISSTTDTGIARAKALYPNRVIFRFPLDLSGVVRSVLGRVRPTLIVLVELEVWYHLVHLARRSDIPVVVVNGRLSERSVRRFGLIRSVARRMFESLEAVAAQDDEIASRFRAMGVPADRCVVTGSLKWDTAEVADRVAGQDEVAAALGLAVDRPIVVCGSTGPGEEALLLDVYRRLRESTPGLQFVLVPRKPERFSEVAARVRAAGFQCVRRSECADGGSRSVSADDVWLVDTMGELRKLYALATVVFVGRSLVPMGGSDPMEVAALGKPIVIGPHTENFRQAVRALEQRGGLRVVPDAGALAIALRDLLADSAAPGAMGVRARQTVIEHQGATRRTVELLGEVLDRRR
jgi:3-deoxy-D-manno-octulosonic-acid transferase